MIGLVHLSDIHFSSKQTNILATRANALAAAVLSVTRDCTGCIIVVSGDIAYEGSKADYDIAEAFFSELEAALLSELPDSCKLTWIAVPGNHDCNHAHASQLRKVAISRHGTGGNPDSVTISLASEVLKDFSAFSGSRFNSGAPVAHELIRMHRITVGEHVLVFYAINSAWCSQNPEPYGDLWLPEAAFKSIRAVDADLAVGVFHFPLQWYDFESRRSLRRVIDSHCQLVLTGHEHEDRRQTLMTADGFACDHFEGGVLQSSHPPHQSQFSVIGIDLKRNEIGRTLFTWSDADSRYTRASLAKATPIIRRKGLAGNPTLSHSSDFEDFLDDLGTPISHPSAQARHLFDFFVWPDVTLDVGASGSRTSVVSSMKLPAVSKRYLHIAGAERSGKTSLGKQILRQRVEQGKICIWLDIAECERSLRMSLDAALDYCVSKQFGQESVELIRQLLPEQLCLIVDNLHLLPPDIDREHILRSLKERYSSVIMFSSEDWASEQTASADRLHELFSFQFARLMPFGPRLRHQLVSKWVRLVPSVRHDAATAERRIELFAAAVDGLVGRDLVPPFPSTLLVMLQTMEAQDATAINHGSLGHTYHTLIHSRLSQGVTTAQTNMRIRYLTELASAFFSESGAEWSEARLCTWHRRHLEQFGLGLEADSLPQELRTAGILDHRGGLWHFRHKYVYFYFVAEHIRTYP